MKPAESTLVYYYNEAIIQFGFIALFATAFPFAPLFSFLTNLLEIAIKMQHISKFGRRNFAQGTSGIGNWNSIMNFVSYVAIPVNLLVLLFCRYPKVTVGYYQDLDNIDPEEESIMISWLRKKDPVFWNRANCVIFCIFMEHIVITLKILIAKLIPDVPFEVIRDEARRDTLEKKALNEMTKLKMDGKFETLEEIHARLMRDSQANDEDPDDLVNDDNVDDFSKSVIRSACRKRQFAEAIKQHKLALREMRAVN